MVMFIGGIIYFWVRWLFEVKAREHVISFVSFVLTHDQFQLEFELIYLESSMSLWAIQSLASVSRGFADGRKPSYETIESLLLQLELIYREFLVKHALLSLDANEEEAISHIIAAVKILVIVLQKVS